MPSVEGDEFAGLPSDPEHNPALEALKAKLNLTQEELETALKAELYGVYMNGLDEDRGFYAREAEESGLLAVYKHGFVKGLEEARKLMTRILE